MFSSKVVEGCFGMVHRQISIRWQNSPETSEAASLDAASVPEKKIQWPNRMRKVKMENLTSSQDCVRL